MRPPSSIKIRPALGAELARLWRRVRARNVTGWWPRWTDLLAYSVASAHERLTREGVPEDAPEE